jgi:hypothetical protein
MERKIELDFTQEREGFVTSTFQILGPPLSLSASGQDLKSGGYPLRNLLLYLKNFGKKKPFVTYFIGVN